MEESFKENIKELSDYKFALDQTAIIAITDQTGIIKHVNANFCKITKYNQKELIGQDHRIINSGHHSKEFIKTLWTTIVDGNVWKGELKNKAKDGNIYWADTAIVPFLNEKGKPYQYMAIQSDITERKKTEEEIIKFNKNLEEQLNNINKELEAFSYSVSHDLRAPLRAVHGYAQMLSEDYGPQFDDEGNRIIQNIKYNATKMGTLIDDLLAFSRLGRKEVQKREIDLNEMLEGVIIELNKTTTHHADIKINKLHTVQADYGLLYKAIYNLVSNGIKFSSKKTASRVEISSKKLNGEIIISIKDNGVGFDMRYVDKLFGVFQRLHSQEEFEGTGVGLAVVQRIITKHHGKVWAEGKIDEGATFFISLKCN